MHEIDVKSCFSVTDRLLYDIRELLMEQTALIKSTKAKVQEPKHIPAKITVKKEVKTDDMGRNKADSLTKDVPAKRKYTRSKQ